MQIAWKDSAAGSTGIHRAPMMHTDKMVSTALVGRIQSPWYGSTTYLANVDVSAGFGEFWFEIAESAAAEPSKENQNGAGFRLPTDKIMVAEGTCHYDVRIAVHESVHAKAPEVFIELDTMTPDNRASAPPTRLDLNVEGGGEKDSNGFVIYTLKLEEMQWSQGYGVVAMVDGTRVELPHTERNQFCS